MDMQRFFAEKQREIGTVVTEKKPYERTCKAGIFDLIIYDAGGDVVIEYGEEKRYVKKGKDFPTFFLFRQMYDSIKITGNCKLIAFFYEF